MKRRNIISMGIGMALATVCGVKSLEEVRGTTATYTSQVIRMEKKANKLHAWLEAELKTNKGSTIKIITNRLTWDVDKLKDMGVHEVRHVLIDECQAEVARIEKDYNITVLS